MINNIDVVNTDVVAPESIEDLCSKMRPYAAAWSDTADRLWKDNSEE